MKKIMILMFVLCILGWSFTAIAEKDMSGMHHGTMDVEKQDEKTSMTGDHHMSGKDPLKAMEDTGHGGTFEKKVTVDGIRAEFQVMSLASMNMTDPDGASHHIMVKFFHESMNHQIKNAIGKIKVINPDEKTQQGNLKNYGGTYAANFTFDASGKYGVICLIRIDDKDHVYRFWYPHH